MLSAGSAQIKDTMRTIQKEILNISKDEIEILTEQEEEVKESALRICKDPSAVTINFHCTDVTITGSFSSIRSELKSEFEFDELLRELE